MTRPILIVIGTRPEAIKLLPVYFACQSAQLPVTLCATSQHDLLLKTVLDLFRVTPHYDLQIMRPQQDLFYVTQAVLGNMKEVLQEVQPALVLVQGDTTTAMAATLAAFYARIPVGHIEAGLRTNDVYSPFPEEMNRRFISLIAAYHFAPTAAALANVLLQGVHRNMVFHTGNTVVDALRIIRENIANGSVQITPLIRDIIQQAQSREDAIILLTVHRRESLNIGLDHVLQAIKQALLKYERIFVIFPYHPNPIIKQVIERSGLIGHQRIFICEAIAYHDLIYILSNCKWVMTDSGGIQEEAASLGKQTLVLRDNTERMESVWAGLSHIVGTDVDRIIQGIDMMQNIQPAQDANNLYGDGYAADKIVRILQQTCLVSPHTQQAGPLETRREV